MNVQWKNTETPTGGPGVERVDNRIYFYTEVTQESALTVNKVLREAADAALWNALKHHTKPRIWLHINSYGGDVFSMFGIADTIRTLPVPVTTVIDGVAASAASIIALAGTKRYITANSFILVHQLSSWMWGKHEEFKDELVMQHKLMQHMIDTYVHHTSLTKKQVKRHLKHDWWIDAQEAKHYGFVTKILKG